MKSIFLGLLIAGCIQCSWAGDTNIIAASEWSEPVVSNDHSVRARLVIVEGGEPAYGGPKSENFASTFVELQNVTGACCPSVKVYFDVQALRCQLTGTNGLPVPLADVGGWGGRGPLGPSWVVLPYNSTVRLFVNTGSRTPWRIYQDGWPTHFWSIPAADTNVYNLSGTLVLSAPTNGTLTVTPPESMSYHFYSDWTGKLTFPKTRISNAQQQ